MEKTTATYRAPSVGCILGSAFQTLTRQLEAALKRERVCITAGEYMILRALYSKDGLQQCEIADMVGKDKASVSRSVAALAKKELLTTECVSHKCTKAWLTSKAREIEPLIMKIAEERHAALLAVASAEDVAALTRVLYAILDKN